MSIREFELFHGAALTKIVRAERPVTLRLIETRPDDAWATYRLNDEVELFVKHSTSPKPLRGAEGFSWRFVFSGEQLSRIASSLNAKKLHVALVCGGRDVKEDQMEICLLKPEDIEKALNLNDSRPQTVTVRRERNKYLRVYKERKEVLRVPLSSLEKWQIPGS